MNECEYEGQIGRWAKLVEVDGVQVLVRHKYNDEKDCYEIASTFYLADGQEATLAAQTRKGGKPWTQASFDAIDAEELAKASIAGTIETLGLELSDLLTVPS